MTRSRFESAVSDFGKSAKAKLSNIAIHGEPEDQLRGPLENLLGEFAEICGFVRDEISSVGETSLSSLKTRPDYAITVRKTLVGFIEVKAPGKGADPRKFKDKHDKEQWIKLQSLPNLLYTDGNQFSLWRDGKIEGSIITLMGDVESAGSDLTASQDLLGLFENFFRWQPIPPRNAKELAGITARLCRLLRDEVAEQLSLKSPALTALATDWRKLLFPEATDAQFADGYAQAVTFGLLMARAKEITLSDGLDNVSRELARTNTLIGAALRLLTDDATNQETLSTSLGTLIRVLDAVHWSTISKNDPETWLYFYEDFLEEYDNALRKKTGSYYTPPEVVSSMVRLVDEALRSRFQLHSGLASPTVTVADPAIGTGTFLLGVLRKIAETVGNDEGPGSISEAIDSAISRLVGFEIQLGPFAVAQLRILAELNDLIGSTPAIPPRMFVADTLSDPYGEPGWLPAILAPIAESREKANHIKLSESITVVIGNPPYKEKAKGRGGWVESGSQNSPETAPLEDWIPPSAWGVSAHSKHLRNLYVYFWRWATWKVFDHDPNQNTGIVCFITVAGFLSGPGFERMRDYLRRKTDEVWIIDCSPEGHQPEVNTRIFQGVQQPVCIVLASRSPETNEDAPAAVHFRSLSPGKRDAKFDALRVLNLDSDGWVDCTTEWRGAFLPRSGAEWSGFPTLEDFFVYNGSGVMPGRTWVIAPDADSLRHRWNALVNAPDDKKEELFHPHLAKEGLGDRHVNRLVERGLPNFISRQISVAEERGQGESPIRYGYRSFDRQWIIPDNRLINRANPELWERMSDKQVFMTALSRSAPGSGPAFTFTALIPDMDHFKGSFGGRVFPLWADSDASAPNLRPALLSFLSESFGLPVSESDLMGYIAAVGSHPGFTQRFKQEMVRPGIRIPLTSDPKLFADAIAIGKEVIWLHTFGERFSDAKNGRPSAPPRLPDDLRPQIPQNGAIPRDSMPDSIEYDESKRRLIIGEGFVENVSPEMWNYEVSGKHVLKQWFSYRKADRTRPIIGDRRPPSPLGSIQPDHWLAEYTTELINVLNVLGRLIELEPTQEELLDKICAGKTISRGTLDESGALELPESTKTDARSEPLLDLL